MYTVHKRAFQARIVKMVRMTSGVDRVANMKAWGMTIATILNKFDKFFFNKNHMKMTIFSQIHLKLDKVKRCHVTLLQPQDIKDFSINNTAVIS